MCACVCVHTHKRNVLDSHFFKQELIKLIEVFHACNDLPLAEGESPPLLHHSGTHRHSAYTVVVGEGLTDCRVRRGGEGRGREGGVTGTGRFGLVDPCQLHTTLFVRS